MTKSTQDPLLPLPSPADLDGRDRRGRFGKGNKAGRGNPLAGRVQRLRAALIAAVKPQDLREVIAGLVTAAKAGDVQAAKLLLDRCCGPAAALDVELRLAALELQEKGERRDELDEPTTPA